MRSKSRHASGPGKEDAPIQQQKTNTPQSSKIVPASGKLELQNSKRLDKITRII